MSLRIKLADTPAEMDALYRARNAVFVEEMRYWPSAGEGRSFDRFDAYPGTVNFVALEDGEVIGGVRGVDRGALKCPADELFDFEPHLPHGARVSNAGMFFVRPDARNRARVMFALQGMGFLWAMAQGYTHLVTIAAPLVESMHQRVGWQVLRERFRHEKTQLWAMPMLVDLTSLHPRLMGFVVRHRLAVGLERFDRCFFKKGEIVPPPPSEELGFLVLDGEVALPPGAGADGLVTGSAATVTALTDVEVAVVPATSSVAPPVAVRI